MSSFVIYTDGSCKGNPGPGGWGCIVTSDVGDVDEVELFGGERWTTNQRMELTAAIEALSSIPPGQQVVLYTDSMYVLNGITSWIKGWKRNGWRTSGKSAVKNVDLWKALDELAALHVIEWRWVKGHAGDPGNERADKLANLGAEQA